MRKKRTFSRQRSQLAVTFSGRKFFFRFSSIVLLVRSSILCPFIFNRWMEMIRFNTILIGYLGYCSSDFSFWLFIKLDSHQILASSVPKLQRMSSLNWQKIKLLTG
ncbi:hypothetical protein CEXT_287221 [Caerostris extrusa]|uniref:Uncharacterized protein n=1 Tax=Caerostris extrusa TaxID=172846 RepID=A0AAV4NXJ3_CAEEX|nr:hypothetical protein CEXT_287221 [Caerostris extrusa]